MTDLEKLLTLRAAVIRFLTIDSETDHPAWERYGARDRMARLVGFIYHWERDAEKKTESTK